MSSIRLEGVEEVLGALDDLKDTESLETALGTACALVERSAKQKAPKDTGALRQSITSEVRNLEGVVFTPLFYAPYVEYGTGLFAEQGGRTDVPWWYKDDKGEWHKTSGQHPQPFMRPALDENREQILRILREALANG
jgi:HK97 gp10 family phage protein